jgi:hypothetical protein
VGWLVAHNVFFPVGGLTGDGQAVTISDLTDLLDDMIASVLVYDLEGVSSFTAVL